MKKVFTIFSTLITICIQAQNIGINSTGAAANTSALLDVDAAPSNDKGMLIPRIQLTDVSVQAPVTGTAPVSLIVYNTSNTTINGSGEGYYYWSGSKWINIPAPPNGPGTSGQVLVSNGSNIAPSWQAPAGTVPIGTIVAWHKSLTNTPPLTSDWAECNGQTLVDPFSPYNGQVIPNLNSDTQDGSINSGMFLRGGSTSGIKQPDGTAPNGLSGTVFGLMSASNTSTLGAGWWNGNPSAPVTFSSTDSETRPANMTVIWIMRVR